MQLEELAFDIMISVSFKFINIFKQLKKYAFV